MKYDIYRNGRLTISGFRKFLDGMMFVITDQTFNDLLAMLKINPRKALTFAEFEGKFIGSSYDEANHQILPPKRKAGSRQLQPSPPPPLSSATAEQVMQCLHVKVEQTWSTIASAFKSFDHDGNGIVTRKDLQAICFKFNLPLNSREFERLWRNFDEANKGYVSFEDFVDKLGVTFAPGDKGLQGTSEKIHDEHDATERDHKLKQYEKQDQISSNQLEFVTNNLTAETVRQQLIDRFRENYANFVEAFKSLDRNNRGYITIKDFRRTLRDLNYYLSSDQFERLLEILHLPCSDHSKLSYFDFLRSIDEGRASRHGDGDSSESKQQLQKPRVDPRVLGEVYAKLSVERACAKLRELVTQNYHSLQSAFTAFDSSSSCLNIVDFRRVIDNFCVRLSDKQFKYVASRCQRAHQYSPGSTTRGAVLTAIDWQKFLRDFSLVSQGGDDVDNEFNKFMASTRGAHDVMQAIMNSSPGESLSRDEFRRILEESYKSLNDVEFEQLWLKQKLNGSNSLDLVNFLTKHHLTTSNNRPAVMNSEVQFDEDDNQELPASPVSDLDVEIEMEHCNTGRKTGMSGRMSPVTVASRLMTGDMAGRLSVKGGPLPSASRGHSSIGASTGVHPCEVGPDEKIRAVVYDKWKTIQKKCKDHNNSSKTSVPSSVFLEILKDCGAELSVSESSELIGKYELKNGEFPFKNFLKHFLLTLKPRDEGILERKVIHQSRIPVMFGKENQQFCDVMIKLRERLLHCWKEMRRTFRTYDIHAFGFISPKIFRSVLEQYSISLSEEDFFNLMSYYDHRMVGRIPYNEFLRAFLKN